MSQRYRFTDLPRLTRQGLYDPSREHDACGVGFVAHIKGKKSHRIIEQGSQILCNLDHRGAVGADPLMGDGAGMLIQIPDQFFREEMAKQGKGSIVNISSIMGFVSSAEGHPGYSASKGAVRLLTKAAAVECARLGLGIRVNSLHPGVVETDMGNNFVQGFVKLGLAPDLDTARRDILALHPLGRFGDVDDVAHAVHYLASDASKWVTGAELCIDGGIAAS